MRIQDRAKEGRSWMDEESENRFIDEMLGLGEKHIDVLEWGPGFSTKYFTAVLRSRDISFQWDAVEYDKDWYVLIKSWGLPNVNLFLFKEKNPEDRQWMRTKPMKKYIDFPKKRGKRYDLIFIDGRKRAKCLEMARDWLKENGFVLLHDAQREEYQTSFKYYDYVFLTESLWKGKPKKE